MSQKGVATVGACPPLEQHSHIANSSGNFVTGQVLAANIGVEDAWRNPVPDTVKAVTSHHFVAEVQGLVLDEIHPAVARMWRAVQELDQSGRCWHAVVNHKTPEMLRVVPCEVELVVPPVLTEDLHHI